MAFVVQVFGVSMILSIGESTLVNSASPAWPYYTIPLYFARHKVLGARLDI